MRRLCVFVYLFFSRLYRLGVTKMLTGNLRTVKIPPGFPVYALEIDIWRPIREYAKQKHFYQGVKNNSPGRVSEG